jgi:hypothetical protein
MSANRPLVPPRGRRGDLITGRLEGHGKANYQFEPDGSPSYYLKLVTGRGIETLWGTDLERAITRSRTKPEIGTLIGVRRIGSEAVTIPAREDDRSTDRQRTFHRARWVVESVSYFAQSAQHAKREVKAHLEDRRTMSERPELRSTFVSLQIAQQFAEQHIRDPRDRELFVKRVKAMMAANVSPRSSALPGSRKSEEPSSPALLREEPTR